jgi:hypothetical protein
VYISFLLRSKIPMQVSSVNYDIVLILYFCGLGAFFTFYSQEIHRIFIKKTFFKSFLVKWTVFL